MLNNTKFQESMYSIGEKIHGGVGPSYREKHVWISSEKNSDYWYMFFIFISTDRRMYEFAWQW